MGQLRLAVLPGVRLAALAAQQVHHQLQTVADAQHGNTHGQHLRVDHGSAGIKHCGGTAGEDDGVRGKGPDLIHGHAEGLDLAVYAAFTDAAGHQQVILAAEIQHKNLFHTGSSSRKVMWSGVASSMTAREWMG